MLPARTKNGSYSLTRLCVLQLVMGRTMVGSTSTLTEQQVSEQLTGVLFSPSSTTLRLPANNTGKADRMVSKPVVAGITARCAADISLIKSMSRY